MKRQLNWAAFPGILISAAMLFLGVGFFLIPMLTSGAGEIPIPVLLFLVLWVGLVLFSGIRATMAFLGIRSRTARSLPLGNLYGPEGQGGYDRQTGHSRYYKEAEDPANLEQRIADSLYQLELMRQDGTISQEEYEFSKKKIMKQLHP